MSARGCSQPPAGAELPPLCSFIGADAAVHNACRAQRKADMPFIVRNVPDVARTAATWSHDPDTALTALFGDRKFGVTCSSSASFL